MFGKQLFNQHPIESRNRFYAKLIFFLSYYAIFQLDGVGSALISF
jgi:hypothetical protein